MNVRDYKTLLWDWNGTIINDTALCYEIFCQECELYSLQNLSLDEYRYRFFFPVEEFYRSVGFTESTSEYIKLAERFGQLYSAKRRECGLQPYVIEILQTALDNGTSNHILSAYRDDSLKAMVKEYELQEYFTTMHGLSNQHAHSKLQVGMELLAQGVIESAKTLFIGDTVHDWEVAHKMGIDCVLVANGHNSFNALKEQCQNVLILSSLSELFDR